MRFKGFHTLCSVFLIGAAGWVTAAGAAILTVTSHEDSGPNTLRQAFVDAADGDTIVIAAGSSITVFSTLERYAPVTLDGRGATLGAAGAGLTVLRFWDDTDGSIVRDLAVVDGDTGVYFRHSDGSQVLNCRIGTDWEDAAGRGNNNGIWLVSCDHFTVGAPGQGNVISGNAQVGVRSEASSFVTLQGNRLGTNAAGSGVVGPQQYGAIFYSGASCLVGGSRAAGAGNLISGHSVAGLVLGNGAAALTGVTVAGNVVGLDAAQTAALGNGNGIYVYSPLTTGCVIGVNDPDRQNVICGNTNGVILGSTWFHTVQNNRIGLNEADVLFPNARHGLILDDAHANLIGGTRHPHDHRRNVIAGHTGATGGVSHAGIYLTTGASGNTIAGNYIGTDGAGASARPNGHGIFLADAHNNLIGGEAANSATARGNLLAGNSAGIVATVASGNSIFGNTVGLALDEHTALGNQVGIYLLYGDAVGNFIGSSVAAHANVVAGNTDDGVNLSSGAARNFVRGNRVGFTRDGLTQRPNARSVVVSNAFGNWIGGPQAADGNLIDGMMHLAVDSAGNTVAANRIGVTAALGRPPATYTRGLTLYGGARGNFIGLPQGGIGNLIANQDYGVYLTDSATDSNGLYGNTICAAATAAVFLGSGVNEGKIAPAITSARPSQVRGTSAPNDYIELFRAESAAGRGGSLAFQGHTTADGSGQWSLAPAGLSAGDFVCALATDAANNTSNFSLNATVAADPSPTPSPTATAAADPSPTPSPTATVSPTPTVTPTATPGAPPADLRGRFALACPNPGRSSISFVLHLDSAADIRVAVYNLAGERVTELQAVLDAGSNRRITWDCRSAAPGVYLAGIYRDGRLQELQRVAVIR